MREVVESLYYDKTRRGIRAVMLDGAPWWFARDICEVLKIYNVPSAIARLAGDESFTARYHDGRVDEPIISTPGLFYLMFTERANPECRELRHWVMYKGLPLLYKRMVPERSPQSEMETQWRNANAISELEILRDMIDHMLALRKRNEQRF